MSYDNYSVSDFIIDDSFKKAVKNPDSEEGLFLEKWVLENPGKREMIKRAKQIILSMDFKTDYLSRDDIKILWTELNERIEESEHHRIINRHKSVNQIFIHYRKLAAVFIGLLVFSAALFIAHEYRDTTEYTTAYGEIKTFVLPDNSTVVLNANSTLVYSSGWNNKNLRAVSLNGEAFFSVVQKPNNQKFIVNSSGLDIEVLGTEFNVYNRRSKTKVVLNSGSVKLKIPAFTTKEVKENKTQEIVMKPGELVEYSTESNKLIQKEVNTGRYSAWKNNLLVFDEMPISEIIEILEDNYGLHVVLEDVSLAKRKFSATYPADNIDILLKALTFSFDLQISKMNNKIILRNKKQ